MNINVLLIAEILKANLSNVPNQGLLHGNIGISIFFSHIYRHTKDAEYEVIAAKLLDVIFESINNTISNNFEDGLAGIGWGLEYLIKNKFVKGNIDETLEEVDDRIYKFLNENNHTTFELSTGLTGYLFYIISRLNGEKIKQSRTQKINTYLLIHVINRIDELVTAQFHTIVKDKYFDLLWKFPILLQGLDEAIKLELYNEKIITMIRQWVPYFESYIPSVNINRLYLATALMKIINSTHVSRLERQIKILLFATDFKMILSELDPRPVNTRYGLPGFLYILELAVNIFPTGFPNYTQMVSLYHKIIRNYSIDMNGYISGLEPNVRQLGLSEGISGIGLCSIIDFFTK